MSLSPVFSVLLFSEFQANAFDVLSTQHSFSVHSWQKAVELKGNSNNWNGMRIINEWKRKKKNKKKKRQRKQSAVIKKRWRTVRATEKNTNSPLTIRRSLDHSNIDNIQSNYNYFVPMECRKCKSIAIPVGNVQLIFIVSFCFFCCCCCWFCFSFCPSLFPPILFWSGIILIIAFYWVTNSSHLLASFRKFPMC